MSEQTVRLHCRACASEAEFRIFSAREMLFGTRQRFEYGECPVCGSLQIRNIPQSLAEFYPSNYYSLQAPPVRRKTATVVRRLWARWLLRGPGGGLAAQKIGRKAPFFHWCREAGCGLDSRILDVGCGNGWLLRRMQRYGFGQLFGVDPYTANEADEPGFSVVRAELSGITGKYHFIMMHHVLEHLIDPLTGLEEARARLESGGRLLVRIPVAGSRTSRLYGVDWFNLDPPRHLLVPSRRGMERLAERSGFRIFRTEFDAMETGYLVSEDYKRDVPFTGRPIDSLAQRNRFRKLADHDNRNGEGDQGVFWLEAR
jgi:SAM-dependent methyltransferase